VKYYIIAGEPSGDKHGASLIKELSKKDTKAEFRFWGGDEMSAATRQKPVTHIKDMAFMGFVEVIKNIFTIRRFFTKAKNDIHDYHPDSIIFVDYPGFNLRMAKWAKLQGYKVIYYISPSVWAWRKSRVYDIKKYVDVMICILPFEVDFYKKYEVNAVYYGNPFCDQIKAVKKDEHFLSKYEIKKPILALLPGSRVQEINRLLPTLLRATKAYALAYDIVIAKANNLDESIYQEILGREYGHVKLIKDAYHQILAHAYIAAVTSGTATLETALFNVPQVVVYKATPISYLIAKNLVKLKYISLVNLIPDLPLVKELIQGECNEDNIKTEVDKLLSLSLQQREVFYKPLHVLLDKEDSAVQIASCVLEYSM
jgi:lipid-A-disaccharide synthase